MANIFSQILKIRSKCLHIFVNNALFMLFLFGIFWDKHEEEW